jgi:hypothetical protein
MTAALTRPASVRSPPGPTTIPAATMEPPRSDLASLVADFCASVQRPPSPPVLCAPCCRRDKGDLSMGTLHRRSCITAASKDVFGSHLRFCGLHLHVQVPAGQARSMQ